MGCRRRDRARSAGSVISSDRSERDFSIHSLNSRPAVRMRAPWRRLARMAKRARAAAARNRSRLGGSASTAPTSR